MTTTDEAIAIVGGILGSVTLILSAFMIYLFVALYELKNEIKSMKKRSGQGKHSYYKADDVAANIRNGRSKYPSNYSMDAYDERLPRLHHYPNKTPQRSRSQQRDYYKDSDFHHY